MPNSIFLVGAGVSHDPPSGLPSGAGFAGMMFDLVTETGSIFADRKILAKLRPVVGADLRLETFFELLASEIAPHSVFQFFEIFRPAEANFAHLAVTALSPGVIITANQDLLLERAVSLLKCKPLTRVQTPTQVLLPKLLPNATGRAGIS